VFFTTSQPLLKSDKDSGVDLYEAEIEGKDEHARISKVVQVSRGGAGDPTPGSGAGVLGVARVSEDGSHVYFVAEGRLTGANKEGKAPVAEAPNLYVVTRECPGGGAVCGNPVERTSFVATLSAAGDGADWSGTDVRPVQATPEGRFLVFQSTADLTPDQEGQTEAGQVFEYDAQTETLARVSRGQNGYNEDGNSSVYPATIPIQEYDAGPPTSRSAPPTQRFTNLAVSEDGSRVFFSSRDALTPQALNGVNNVYEYHGGHVGLISDGHDTVSLFEKSAVELIGTDESGSDVFFTTADSLVPQDNNTQTDIYDARVNGGFAPPTERAQCSVGACRAPASEPLPLLAPATSSVAAEAVATPVLSASPPKPKATKRKKAKKRKRPAHKRRGKRASGRRR
jgi:hypothetical protein